MLRAVSTIRDRLNTHGASDAGPHFVNTKRFFVQPIFLGPLGSYRVRFIILGAPDKGSTDSFRSIVYINHDSNSKVSNQ